MKILMLLVIFLLFGAFFIISQENLSLNKIENREKFVSLYKGWMDKLIENAGSVSGYVLKLEWLPKD